MNGSNRRTDPNLEFLYARLDEIRMSGLERVRAKASLARADAIAGLMVDAANGARRLLCTLVVQPIRRLATSIG